MLERGLKYIVFCLMILLVALVSLQVFTRFILNNPLHWSEEAAALTQIFLVFLGAALSVFTKQTLRITVLVDRLHPRTAILIDLLFRILITVFLLTVIYYSTKVALNLQTQLTAALRVPKGYIFFALIAGSVLMLIGTLREIRNKIVQLKLMSKNEIDRSHLEVSS